MSDVARELLEALGIVNRLFRDHSIYLRRLADVREAKAVPLEVVSYPSGIALEGCVEAQYRNGDLVCWCLDVRREHDRWVLEATLDKKSGDRQETMKELPSQTIETSQELAIDLPPSARKLLALSL
jgi:hypothetical protein